MRILAIDTALAACSAAVIDTTRPEPLAEWSEAMERGHAEAIAPMVRRVMAGAGIVFAELDLIAVTRGPGTFTGVRIGLAMARGLGLAISRDVAGVDTLQAISCNEAAGNGPLLALTEARGMGYFAGLYSPTHETLRAPALLSGPEIARMAPEGAWVIGGGAERFIAECKRPDLRRSLAGNLPRPARFGAMAATLPAGEFPPQPLYLREADAKPVANFHSSQGLTFSDPGAECASLLAELHAQSFDKPWTAAALTGMMDAPGMQAVIAAMDGRTIGFGLFRQAADECEILTLCVNPPYRRQGVAKALVGRQLARLSALGARRAFLEVAESNGPARHLYAGLGFTEAGLRRNYYQREQDPAENALIMAKELTP
jgi:tRNA threonylcarbamoyladenosine biosynthesis protein TsaB